MAENKKKTIFLRCCYSYMISGMAVLVIGAILPLIIAEAGMNYTQAGALLSMMAIGNLSASLFYPVLSYLIGQRTIIYLSALVPVSFFFITYLPPISIFCFLMILLGIARGAITITNNSVVNKISDNSPKMLNLLHCSFAVGAFLAPFLTALLLNLGLGWKHILYLLILLCTTSAFSYSMLVKESGELTVVKKNVAKTENKRLYLKSADFYLIGLVLFFYLGIENCISGWFVTYLQNIGVMTKTHATMMVSVTWLVIMIGRIVFAALTKYCRKTSVILLNALGSSICFFLLINTKNLTLITAALTGLGFFLSGIYPTAIAYGGIFIQNSASGMSLLTAISALGGIITPQIVGMVADQKGISTGVNLLVLNVVIIVILSSINAKRERGVKAKRPLI